MNPTKLLSCSRLGALCREIRNPNIEARNKSETRMMGKNVHRAAHPSEVAFQPFDIRICFGFRISNFEFSATGCASAPVDLESRERIYRWS